MTKVISTEKKPIKLWLDNIEDGALEQVKNLANLPFIFKHIAIMPDAHQGYGMPIGGIMATRGVVVPNAVGVDIGCGMCAVKTSLTEIDTETLKKIMGEIRKVVPVGFNKHKESQNKDLMPAIIGNDKKLHPFSPNLVPVSLEGKYPIVKREYENALKSLGTLGGGNHFIEIQKGSDGHIWIMIHSGSRNLGLKIAEHYNKLAIQLNEKYFSQVPKQQELAFLPLDTEEAQDYLKEMQYAVDFALANRKLMMERVIDTFRKIIVNENRVEVITFDEIINIAHNYASMENHFGENVMVHRKGATMAREGQIGIIPGSLGSPSYITQGLGNQDSFCSSPHGAGRKMGRKQAIRELDLKNEIKILNEQNIVHGLRNKNDLDEATGSYKNVDEVVENSKDLVKVLVKLRPLASIKG